MKGNPRVGGGAVRPKQPLGGSLCTFILGVFSVFTLKTPRFVYTAEENMTQKGKLEKHFQSGSFENATVFRLCK